MSEILILDSDPALAATYRSILEAEGYHVVGVTTGSEAIDVMRADRPSLVLLAAAMASAPKGIDVSQEIEADPDLQAIPIVIIAPHDDQSATGIGNERTPLRARIARPTQPKALLATVRQFVH